MFFMCPLIETGMNFVRNMFYPVERLFGEWHLLKGNKCLQSFLTKMGAGGGGWWQGVTSAEEI